MFGQMKLACFTLFLTFLSVLFSQEQTITKNGIEKKIYQTQRTQSAPKIDGNLDDLVWQDLAAASNFVERRPTNGQAAPKEFKTEVKILYDDQAIYFAAKMYDAEPDKIQKELTERDDIANDDFFSILINGYNDSQQSASFIVTAAGVQWDAQSSNNGEDETWNAIWQSAAKITKYGWAVEMKIPYRELRFPEKPIQEWGLQMEREVRRTRTRYSWNYVDNTRGTFLQHDGILQGIKNIKTPVRLSLFPYVSAYANNVDGETEVQFNGGADIKYGINDAFTLDATLVPDFGQAGFDEVILNLGPIEQQFAEQRQFFVEGTEIFSKGNLFFSRRVGGRPSGVLNLAEDDEVLDSPGTVDLINAVKVSGRTNKGLGVGIFNAITQKAEATVRNNTTNEIRTETAEPFANYSVLVLDQRFGNNSSVALVNTNVMRSGSFTDANVTGAYFDYFNKKNTYNYFASVEQSLVFEPDNQKSGNEFRLGFNNRDGAHRFGASSFIRTKDYDIDDLGFTGFTNYQQYNSYYSYRYLQPKGNLNNLFINVNLNHRRRLVPDLYSFTILNINTNFNTKEFFSFGGGYETNLGGHKDIFEARTEGKHFNIPDYQNLFGYISTDYRKKYAFDMNVDWYKYDDPGRYDLSVFFFNRYRFSDKFTLSLRTSFDWNQKQEGYADQENNDIIFGQRDRSTVSNNINAQYSFNENMILNLNFRHYYSTVAYSEYYNLLDNGHLGPTNYNGNRNNTFNTWNIDLRYSWWFAPGSQLTMLYRNAIFGSFEQDNLGFQNNFNRLFNEPITNNLSLRIVYFLDYPQVKSWFKKAEKKM